jgi:RNA polymerase sigma factor (sigma-70 family)
MHMNPTDSHVNGQWIRATVDQFEGPLVRYAVHLTGSTETSREVVQDTFMRLCSADRSEVEPHLAQWLFTVCRNRALEVIRKETRMKTLSEQTARECTSREPAQLTALEEHETLSRTMQLLASLPANQQEVVRLKFQNGLSYREISEITSLSVTNVGYLLHTAIQTLRKQLHTE